MRNSSDQTYDYGGDLSYALPVSILYDVISKELFSLKSLLCDTNTSILKERNAILLHTCKKSPTSASILYIFYRINSAICAPGLFTPIMPHLFSFLKLVQIEFGALVPGASG